jgi:NitT/TauT family transport system ATP-binding protein
MAPFIDARDVSVVYQGSDGTEVNALASLSFTVRRNEFVSFVGPSGCGKSTLLKVLGDLIRPSGGLVMIDGRPPEELRRARQIGHMFQESVLLPWKTVGENIGFLSQIAHRPISPTRVSELGELVGLTGFLHRYPHELSGGMRQRAALARAYALEPSLLLMDEPFGALDEITRQRMNGELLRSWSTRPNTVVFVTHSIAEAVYLSDTVYVVGDRPGRIVATVPIDIARPRLPELRFAQEMTDRVSQVQAHLEAGMTVDDATMTPGIG